MKFATRARLRRATSLTVICISAGLIAACSTTPPKAMVDKKQRSKEYFAESEFGVKASPRVTMRKSGVKRGGGRDQVGKPYMVRGKMYYPKEDKQYKKTGLASWYGDAFHGRLTANGEIYDMTHLTAAHPTMPLPSYARVTNVETGSSVIVRVNDRGPYSHGRLIDLSHRAAEMLDYAHAGTAKVKVEYVGRAPLHGNDDSYLMASYKPGKDKMDPSDGLATGVMIAMNGPTPGAPVPAASPFPGVMADAPLGEGIDAEGQAEATPVMTATVMLPGDPELPALGPIAPERPVFDPFAEPQIAMAAMSYAQERVSSATAAFDALAGARLSSAERDAWKRSEASLAHPAPVEPYVAAGSFSDRSEAERLAAALAPFGRTALEAVGEGAEAVYSVNLYSDGRTGIDDLLQSAWTHGAPDALAVRD
jgi:rare lipoprotein A